MAMRLKTSAPVIGAVAAVLAGCWEPEAAETTRMSADAEPALAQATPPEAKPPETKPPEAKPPEAKPPETPKPDTATKPAPPDTLGLRAFDSLVNDGAENVLFSPMSLEAALALLGEAASADWKEKIATAIGRDYEELSAVDDAAKSDKTTLKAAYALWTTADASLTPEFRARAEEAYGAKLAKADFRDEKAAAAINAWVREATGGAIDKIVERLPATTSLVLANAMHFKGDWLKPFDKADTKAAKFQTAAGKAADVQMMRLSGTMPYAETASGQVLRLFYRDTAITMTFYLPKADAKPDAARKDAAAWLFAKEAGAGFSPSEGRLGLPRLNLAAEMDLTSLLPTVGLEGLFGDASVIAAIQSAVPPALSQAVQRTKLDVDETGAEAAAATAIVGVRSSLVQAFEMTLDRPFFFSLRHKAIGAPLIAGYVADPTQSSK